MVGWIVFGLLVGIVAKLLLPGKDPGGFVLTILLGIAGAAVGGYMGRAFGWYREDDPVGFMTAVAGAFFLLLVYRMIASERT